MNISEMNLGMGKPGYVHTLPNDREIVLGERGDRAVATCRAAAAAVVRRILARPNYFIMYLSCVIDVNFFL
jgi:hypothetical protein